MGHSGRTGLLPSRHMLGSKSRWQARFWISKGCGVCPAATNVQGCVSLTENRGPIQEGLRASESFITDLPMCRLKEVLVYSRSRKCPMDECVAPCTANGVYKTGHTVEGLGCQAEWSNLILWVKADGTSSGGHGVGARVWREVGAGRRAPGSCPGRAGEVSKAQSPSREGC